MYRILVVEDEEAIRVGLVDMLEMEGYQVAVAVDGEEAIHRAEEQVPHLVILDLMLPKKSGYDVCRHYRKHFPETFILMLTAKTEEISKISGLEMGADDYVTKPFSVIELMARIKSLLRRVSPALGAPKATEEMLTFGPYRIDFKKYEGKKDGQLLDLSAKEIQIMRYLSQKRGEVVTREELLENIWGYSPENLPTTRTVDNQILKLRQKFEENVANPRFIKSVRGVGYKFDPHEEESG